MPRTPLRGRARRAARLGHRQLRSSFRTTVRTCRATISVTSTGPPTRAPRCSPSASTARRSRRASISCSTSADRWRVTETKLRAYGELSALLACACASTRRRHRASSPRRRSSRSRCTMPEDIERFLACDATRSALEDERLPLRRRSLRIVVSDFLFPHDADALVSRLARDCAVAGDRAAHARARKPSRRSKAAAGWSTSKVAASSISVIDERAIHDYRARFAPPAAGTVAGRPPRRRPLRARRRRPRRCVTWRGRWRRPACVEAA